MKQAIVTRPHNIDFREVEVPDIADDEMLVQIKRIGVCGSDVHVYHGKHPLVEYPVIQGHEVSGQVEKVGAKVSGFKPGDKVTVEPQVSCGKCYACTHGMPNVCANLKVIGFQTPGTAADYFALPERQAVRLPDSMSFEKGAFIEPVSVAVGAVRRGGPVKDKQVLVFGAGPIGILTAQVARAEGASKVVMVDLDDYRLGKARECGLTQTINSKTQSLADEVSNAFAGNGPDISFECVGAEASMADAVVQTNQGGTIVIVGVFPGRIPIDVNLVQEKLQRLVGSARYLVDDYRKSIELVESEALQLDPMITHRLDFAEFEEAYRLIENPNEGTLKIMVSVT